jgi:hypothetical protein
MDTLKPVVIDAREPEEFVAGTNYALHDTAAAREIRETVEGKSTMRLQILTTEKGTTVVGCERKGYSPHYEVASKYARREAGTIDVSD